CAPQSARLAADRLCRQPAPLARRISEPRLPDRRRSPRCRHPAHRRRHATRGGPPLRRSPRARADAVPLSVRPEPDRLSTSRRPESHRPVAWPPPRRVRRRSDDVRSASVATTRIDRTRTAQPQVPHHFGRCAHGDALRPGLCARRASGRVAPNISRITPRPTNTRAARRRARKIPSGGTTCCLKNLTQLLTIHRLKTPSGDRRRWSAFYGHLVEAYVRETTSHHP